MNQAKILSLSEVKSVVSQLYEKVTRSANLHLIIFRLSACCGMRCKEIAGLDIFDVVPNGDRPYIQVRKEVTKGERGKRKARSIPLWWDKDTCLDIMEWRDYRLAQTGGKNGPFLVAFRLGFRGDRLTKKGIARHWNRTIAETLGPERARALSIHKGRHSFTSLCHAAGVSLPELRDALGHSSLAVTDIYCHAVDSGVRSVFGEQRNEQ